MLFSSNILPPPIVFKSHSYNINLEKEETLSTFFFSVLHTSNNLSITKTQTNRYIQNIPNLVTKLINNFSTFCDRQHKLFLDYMFVKHLLIYTIYNKKFITVTIQHRFNQIQH